MSLIAISDWVLGTSGPTVPTNATHVQAVLAPSLSVSGGYPIVSLLGRLYEIQVTYDAAGVYSVAFGGGTAAVANVVADGLANEEAVLDHLQADIIAAYPSLTTARVTISGTDTLVVGSATSVESIQVDCTGGSSALAASASSETATTAVVAGFTTIAGVLVQLPLMPSSDSAAFGALIQIPPGLANISAGAESGAATTGDTSANNATLSRFARVWLRFIRDVP